MVKPNWMRANSSAVSPNIIAPFAWNPLFSLYRAGISAVDPRLRSFVAIFDPVSTVRQKKSHRAY
jgi:hypothetical protein